MTTEINGKSFLSFFPLAGVDLLTPAAHEGELRSNHLLGGWKVTFTPLWEVIQLQLPAIFTQGFNVNKQILFFIAFFLMTAASQ